MHAVQLWRKKTLVGPGSPSLAPGQVGVRTGRLSPGDKGVNMKLTMMGAPGGRGLSISKRGAMIFCSMNDRSVVQT